ncbi:Tetratricopeptide TPR_4 [Catenulispora acidiphila DSM 44928]|uniref:Tetratricopeptide TPR_4 n=1 Tax=Catenulispora acidiphila (strain DSM 44928 / JCM 14897 / NBRC 102108 / NRRL B-24433 / ID139908) TaxID=479433 RepID=C7Q771_CATAD|nr:helix-turn-helix domain-containing protein [Catenulispora acidiphila]ACU70159.1 Tetratricopeptide TPR_4 [Catenulispora acidiphila DSM 44928]
MDEAESAPRDPRALLAAELLAVQEATGLSLKELERVTHVSDSSLSRYLAGRSVPPWTVVQAMSRLARRDPDGLRTAWAAARGARLNVPRGVAGISGGVAGGVGGVGGATGLGRDDLPRAPLGFVGRRPELATLVTTPGVWVVDGMAGVGKSTLAVRAARALAEAERRRTLYLHLHGHTSHRAPLAPEAALTALLSAIGVPDKRIPEDPDLRAALWRGEAARRTPVVVLDDAVDSAQVRPLLPGAADAVVLVTSRRRLVSLEGARSLTLAVPSLPECRELVDVIAGPERRAAEPEAVDAIIEACGRLPLAVQLCAARLRHRPAWSAAFLAERLRDEERRRRELAADGGGVGAALALSVAHLRETERAGFALLGSLPGLDFDVYAAAALIDAHPADAEDLLQTLVDAHLLDESAAGRYRLHDLTRDHARAMADPARAAAERRLVDYHIAAAAAASTAFDPYGSARIGLIQPGLPDDRLPDFADAAEGGAWFEEHLPTLIHLSGTALDARSLALLRNSVCFLWTSGQPAAMTALGHLARTGTRSPGAEEDHAWAARMLGIASLIAGRPEEAIEHFETALIGAGETLRATLIGALSITATTLWRLTQARDYGEQAVAYFRANPDPHRLGLALTNLAEVAKRQRHPEEALTLATEALTHFEQSNYETGRSAALIVIADAERTTHHPHQALDHYLAALHTAEEQQYFDSTTRALQGLAITHRDLADPTQALHYHDRLEKLLTEADPTHPDLPESLNERAHTELTAHHPKHAQATAERALTLAQEAPNPYEEARASTLLANLATLHGDPARAQELNRRAEEIWAALGIAAWDGVAASEG